VSTQRAPASPLRAAGLLVRLRLLRLLNQASAAYGRRLGRGKSRAATPGKRRNRWMLTALVVVFMLFSFGNLARQSILNLHKALDVRADVRAGAAAGARGAVGPEGAAAAPAQPPAPATPRRIRGPALVPGTLSEPLSRGLAMEMSLLCVVVLLMSLGGREIAKPDWDLEWLVTLPLGMRTLLWSRLLERSLANPSGLLILLPAAVLVAWYAGLGWWAPAAGAAATLPLLLLTALGRTLIDTGLRLAVAPSNLRNLQAALSVLGVVMLYIAISTGTPSPPDFILDWARGFPRWMQLLPPGLAIDALDAPDPMALLRSAATLAGETALVLLLGVRLLQWQLRNGVVAASSRETARGAVASAAAGAAAPPGRAPRWFALGTPVQRRELRLLGRDRNFLIQTLVLPLVLVGSQLLLNGGIGGRAFSGASGFAGVSDSAIAMLAFGIAAYMLMLSAFQTINSEGEALWMLFTVPRTLDSILAEKARLWAAIALVYPALIFAAGIALTGHMGLELLGLACVVLVGVPIYSSIAVSLGVFGCDPLAQEVRTRIRPTFIYLYTLLSGLYTYAIFTSDWSQKLVLILLSALLAMALWQKARDELPYLLDPAAAPAATVSTADGLMAAMLFFVLQGAAALALADTTRPGDGGRLIVCYTFAGALTYALVRGVYWRSKTLGVPAMFGAKWRQALAAGAAGGGVAAAAGIGYLVAMRALAFSGDPIAETANALSRSVWLPLLLVVAAPLFEEFIFRGLIFGGLRRTWGALPSIGASAAVFAAVHPPLSMLPVFGLGLCAAWAYNRTRLLLAPTLTHAVYNGALVLYQMNA